MDLIIRHVFDNIAHFEYNQAHRHVQRLIKVHSQLNIPTHFCTILTKLIQYESMFTDLSFSKPKLVFGREDLDDLYRVLMNDADKDKVSYPQHMASQSPLPSTELQLERTVSTSSFSSARLGPKEFAATTNWEFLSHVQEMFAKCNIPDELNALLDSVVDIHGRVDIEAISALSEVFSESIRKEYAVLINLLKCHQATTQYRFKDASQYLYLGRFELIAWKKLCFPNDYHEVL
ncbi:hypothetical protein BKA69DRAFT_1035447 [Paraphysoderma sedebokerense]|nr:hypothetical protein BKA69DRAFT_1035447 [Paraphysoderma sedebokerense]